MTTMNISLPDEMRAFVESRMAREGYASASEYLRALIRQAQRRLAEEELEAKLLEGLAVSAPALAAIPKRWRDSAWVIPNALELDDGPSAWERNRDSAPRRVGYLGRYPCEKRPQLVARAARHLSEGYEVELAGPPPELGQGFGQRMSCRNPRFNCGSTRTVSASGRRRDVSPALIHPSNDDGRRSGSFVECGIHCL